MIKIYTTIIFCLLISISGIKAQFLVEAIDNGSKTAQELFNEIGVPVSMGVQSYKIRYNTTDIKGEPTVASGLLVLPMLSDVSVPIMVYQHGTALERDAVPSNNSAEASLGFFLGANSYIVVMPDYLGLGDNEGLHPYLHADSEASVAIDMIFAAQEFLEGGDILPNEQLFITGYSQGGHAAAALQKKIQEEFSEEFTVTASAPASGPYSMADLGIEGFAQAEEYLSPGFSAATLISYNMVYEIYDDLEAIFKPTYAVLAEQYSTGSISLNDLNTQMVTALIADVGASIPSSMFQDSIIQIFVEADSSHPLIQAAIDNDLTNWVPEAPTRLYYCRDDETVPAQNSIIADSSMNALGATEVSSIDLGGNLNHIQCVTPSGLQIIFFFRTLAQVTTDIDEPNIEDNLQVYPNPARDVLYIDGLTPGANIQLLNLNGQEVRSTFAEQNIEQFNLSGQASGLYLLRIFNDGKTSTRKLIINE